MYPWRSYYTMIQTYAPETFFRSRNKIPLVFKILWIGCRHYFIIYFGFQVNWKFWDPPTIPCLIDKVSVIVLLLFNYVDVMREFIRAQSLGYLSPCQSHSLSSCIDMYVLLQYVSKSKLFLDDLKTWHHKNLNYWCHLSQRFDHLLVHEN